MNPDVIDIILIFSFVFCVFVLALISAIPAALRSSYEAGRRHGILEERERRRGLEQRVGEALAETFKSELWEKELDV